MCSAKQHCHQGRLILLTDVFLDFIVFMAVGGGLGRVIGWLAIIIIIITKSFKSIQSDWPLFLPDCL